MPTSSTATSTPMLEKAHTAIAVSRSKKVRSKPAEAAAAVTARSASSRASGASSSPPTRNRSERRDRCGEV